MKTTKHEALTLLTTLHELARLNQPCAVDDVGRRLGWGMRRVFRVLGHLDERGVADRARCRLTMTGLALAVAVRAEPACDSRAA